MTWQFLLCRVCLNSISSFRTYELKNVLFIQYATTTAKLHFIMVPNIHFHRVLKYKEKKFCMNKNSVHVYGTALITRKFASMGVQDKRHTNTEHCLPLQEPYAVQTSQWYPYDKDLMLNTSQNHRFLCLPVSTLSSDNHSFKNVRGNGASNNIPSLIILVTGILLMILL